MYFFWFSFYISLILDLVCDSTSVVVKNLRSEDKDKDLKSEDNNTGLQWWMTYLLTDISK